MTGGGRPSSARILLVDDDPLIRKGYGQRLKGDGYRVMLAADGYEAVQAADAEVFDVVLLDLQMPYRNGVEVLQHLRANAEYANARVVLLALPGDADLVEQAMRLGADAVFEKARMGPRDVSIELAALLDGTPTAVRPAPGTLAESNVPSAVDEITKRFRRGGGTHSASGRTAADGSSIADRLRAAARMSEYGAEATEPPRDAVDAYAHRHLIQVDPEHGAQPLESAVPAPPQPDRRVEDHGIVPQRRFVPRTNPAATPAADASTPPGPGPAPGAHATATGFESLAAPLGQSEHAVPPPPAPAAPAPVATHSYDTILNRMVGQSAGLAQALGLAANLSCPVCSGQLALRLWPNPQFENGVQGFFHCPRCTAS